MLRVEMHRSLRALPSVEATRVVVYNSANDPVAVVVEPTPNQFITAHVGDPDFNEILKSLGIGKTVIVSDFQEKPISQIRFPQSG